jgi:hypothetical protein
MVILGMVYDCFTHIIQIYSWLVVWNIFYFSRFFHILGMSSSQLTNSIIFKRGRSTTNKMMSNWCLPCLLFGTNPLSILEAKKQNAKSFLFPGEPYAIKLVASHAQLDVLN